MKFGSMDKMIITSSETEYSLVRPGKELITSLGIKDKTRPKKYKRKVMPLGMSV